MSKFTFPLKLLQPLRRQLQVEEVKLKKRSRQLEAEDPFNDTDAAEEFGHDRVAALKLEVDKTLINIRKTLTRIRVGRFGLCENCGNMIDTDRLAIDPTVSLCISCASKK